jgi:hypothetical protein
VHYIDEKSQDKRMTRIVVEPGICEFTTVVEVTRLSAWRVRVVINTGCEMVSEMNSELEELDWRDVLRQEWDSAVYKSSARHIRHAACPIPIAILKAIEVEVGAAVPKDITMQFEATNRE